jgi:hypothetical protein
VLDGGDLRSEGVGGPGPARYGIWAGDWGREMMGGEDARGEGVCGGYGRNEGVGR